jgi:hypothetical protein
LSVREKNFWRCGRNKMPVDLIFWIQKILFPFFFSVLTEGVLSCGEYDTLLHDREKKEFHKKKNKKIVRNYSGIFEKLKTFVKKRSGTQLKTRKTIQDGRDFLLLLLHNVRTHNSVKEAKGDHHHPLRSKCRSLLLITTTTTTTTKKMMTILL